MVHSLQVHLQDWLSERFSALTRLRILLLLLVMWCASRGLVVVTRSAGSGWLGITVLLAVLLGWVLGWSRLSAWKSALLGGMLGLLWQLLTVGGLGAPVGFLLVSFIPVLIALIRPPHLPDFTPFLAAVSSLAQESATLFARFSAWFESLNTNVPVKDPLVEGLLWGLGMWIASAWGGWWLRRRSMVEVALLPGTILFIVPILYAGDKEYLPWLVLVAGGWVLIHALEHYTISRRLWQQRNTDRAEIEPSLVGTVMGIAVVAMLAGGYIPGLSLEKLRDAWNDLFEPEPRVTEGTGGGSAVGSGRGYTTFLKISAGQELPADIIMYITVEGYSPAPLSDRGRYQETGEPELQYYWRAATYSSYNGRTWSNYTSQEQDFLPGTPVYPDLESMPGIFQYITQYVERMDTGDETLYSAGELLSADQPYTVAWRRSGEPVKARTAADNYTAISRLPILPVSQLRQAVDDAPARIRDRYLQLPANLPDRVYNLALDLVVDWDNPYDRAKAIQDYLRQFPYTLDVPAPPAGRDAVDFFLFDLQRGYCNYYASAMTVLARAAGLPTRLVTGYRTGSYDYMDERFVIREENSHAWVEVYFPGIGWVEFEPTSGVPVFSRPGGSTEGVTFATPPSSSGEPPLVRLYWSALRNPLGIAGILALLVLLVCLLPLSDWSLYLHPAEKVLGIIFHRLYRRGKRWGIHPDASRTPGEFNLLLASRLKLQSREKSALDLHELTRLYSRQLFSPNPPRRTEIQHAILLWMRLKRAMRKSPRRQDFLENT